MKFFFHVQVLISIPNFLILRLLYDENKAHHFLFYLFGIEWGIALVILAGTGFCTTDIFRFRSIAMDRVFVSFN